MATKAKITLTKTLNTLMAKQDAFAKSVEALKTFSDEALSNLILEIDVKQNELDELEKKLVVREKDGKICLDQKLREYGYKEASKIVTSRGEHIIHKEEYENLVSENKDLRDTLESKVQTIKEEQLALHKKQLSATITNLELKHKAETATLTAQTEQNNREIVHLNKTIENLRNEIEAQRLLTKEVAIAGKQGAISQTFGK